MNVDAIATYYRRLEYTVFGKALQRRRVDFVSDTRSICNALVLGDGDGRFLEAFLQGNLKAKAHYVDKSAKMTALAKRLTGEPKRVFFQQGDIFGCELPPRRYDLIATHFFLDCFNDEECSTIVRTLARAATEDAVWLISEFRIPERGVARSWAKLWVAICYFFFRWTTGLRTRALPNYRAALRGNGFGLSTEHISRSGMLVSEIWKRGPPVP